MLYTLKSRSADGWAELLINQQQPSVWQLITDETCTMPSALKAFLSIRNAYSFGSPLCLCEDTVYDIREYYEPYLS
jgi:hypothetical protein